MANAVRLLNGGTIQVRTGVLAGVGPEGPRGDVGPQGLMGPQGPRGDVGPIGQITQYQSRAALSTANTFFPNTDTLVSLGNVSYDDLSCFVSTTNIQTKAAGDYLFNVYIEFAAAAGSSEGLRKISIVSSVAGTVWSSSCPAVNGSTTAVNLTVPYRAAANEVFQIFGRSGDDGNVVLANGAVAVTRIGSGPPGPKGDTGATGPVGPQGQQGPAGANGNASGGFATYGDLT